MFNPVAFKILGKEIYWYGIIMSIAVLSAVLLAFHAAKKKGYHPDVVVDLGILAIPMALIFARIYFCVFSWSEFAANPIRIFYIWEGGIAIYGTIIGGVLAGFIFSRWRKVSMWDLMDITAPSLILGQAIGRWGNFFNQEIYGQPVTNKALQIFPLAVYIQKSGVSGWFTALFFYEFVWNMLIFVILLIYNASPQRHPHARGNSFFLYLMLYGVGRIVMEGMRDPQYMLMLGNTGIPASQLLSALLIVGCGLMLVLRHKSLYTTDLPPDGPYVYDAYIASRGKVK